MKLQQIVEVNQVTTFEWHLNKQIPSQYILAAHQNGKISLINAGAQPRHAHQHIHGTKHSIVKHDPPVQQGAVHSAKIEKVFLTASMVQNSRHCMALAWNPVNPRLFAAGHDRTAMNESSLMVWDIEQSMNSYLNRVRMQEQAFTYAKSAGVSTDISGKPS